MTLAVVLLTLATAAIHLSFFIEEPRRGLIYGLNALGYVALVGALYLPIPVLNRFRRTVLRALIAYAALTIVAYVAFGLLRHEWTVPLGPVNKVIELVLIGLLWLEHIGSARKS